MTVDAVLRASEVLIVEAQRRARGEPADPRLDVPLAMLNDLAEALDAERPADDPRHGS